MEQNTNKEPRVRRNLEQIKQLLVEFENSDKDVSKFCNLHNVSHTAFYKWKSRHQADALKNFISVPGFAELKINNPDRGIAAGLFAEVRGIKIYQAVAASYLKELAAS